MDELRSFRRELIEAVVIAKHFYRHKCVHQQSDDTVPNSALTAAADPQASASVASDTAGAAHDSSLTAHSAHHSESQSDTTYGARECILDLIGLFSQAQSLPNFV